MPALTPRILVILGPTAGGKSDLAVGLAQVLGGEILGADSMQVYRHLNAATAKPTAEQRTSVPHHLIDCVEPTLPWTVADWLAAADRTIDALHQRGRLPIVVGGTNLYLKALLEGLFDGPPADPALRQELSTRSPQDLHRELAQVDPQAAGRIDANDRKRITRALEVFRTTGRPISSLQQQWQDRAEPTYRHSPLLIGLRYSAPVINGRINARVKGMFFPPDGGEGLIAETRRLQAAGLLGPQARSAIGTAEALEHLAGRLSHEEAFEKVKIATRRLAKAQRTWMKRYRGVHWLEANSATPQSLLEEGLKIARKELSCQLPL